MSISATLVRHIGRSESVEEPKRRRRVMKPTIYIPSTLAKLLLPSIHVVPVTCKAA